MGKEMDNVVAPPSLDVTSANSAHPARTAKVSRKSIHGVVTDFLVERFGDRVFCLVTQLDKVGTMVEANWEGDFARGTFAVKLVSGRRDEEVAMMVARRVAEIMRSEGCELPVLLSVALKGRGVEVGGEDEQEIFQGIVDEIVENKVWGD